MRQWQVSVFDEPPFPGNQVIVQVHEAPVDMQAMTRIAREADTPTVCFTWPRSAAGGFVTNCFSPAGPIQCCGHGLLATAYVLHNLRCQGREAVLLYQANGDEPLQVELRDKELWLPLPRLRCRATVVPAWVRDAVSIQPVKAAIAGGDGGYLVLEFTSGVALSQLTVAHDLISANTSRAVVVTTQATSTNYHFLLRYFAPQYGVNEDPVTGSASRVLTDYWGQKIDAEYFRALQCSTQGGVIVSRLRPHCVEISGHVTIH